MKIILLPRAEKDLRKLPKFDQIAVAEKIRTFEASAIANEEKLAGYTHIYRVRVGSYRIVYQKVKETITIILIRNRRDAYQMLNELMK